MPTKPAKKTKASPSKKTPKAVAAKKTMAPAATKTTKGSTATKPTKGSTAGVSYEDLRNVIGLAEDDPALAAVLARAGKVTWTKPDGGARYAQAKQAGFDLLVERPRDGKRTDPKRVHTVFLYSGKDGQKHAPFAAPPHGITFTTRADVLAALPAPEYSWIIGDGKVAVTAKGVDHDAWTFDGFKVSVDYRDDDVRSILISHAGTD